MHNALQSIYLFWAVWKYGSCNWSLYTTPVVLATRDRYLDYRTNYFNRAVLASGWNHISSHNDGWFSVDWKRYWPMYQITSEQDSRLTLEVHFHHLLLLFVPNGNMETSHAFWPFCNPLSHCLPFNSVKKKQQKNGVILQLYERQNWFVASETMCDAVKSICVMSA